MLFEREQFIDHVGAMRIQSLFVETNKSKLTPIMTLADYDKEYKGVILPSLHRVYLELADPTEYSVAMEVFGSWKHWERLLGNKAIMSFIKEWRVELEIKLRSAGIKALAATAANEGSKGTTAAKFLAERGWEKRKAGAPSKEEVVREKKVAAGIEDDIDADLKRLGINTGKSLTH